MKNTTTKMTTTQKKKTLNKRDIIRAVRAKGFSARRSTKAVNAMIDVCKYALWCGEDVEVPGGILQVKITRGTEWATLQRFQNIHTKEPMVRTVHTPGWRKVVKLKPDPKLVLALDPPPAPPPPPPAPLPPPPKPETAEEVEERQLTTLLLELRNPADDRIMTVVRRAVGAHPRIPGERLSFRPGALLRRLRQFRAKGWSFSDVRSLAQQVSEYSWL
jgi:nucleoid DNA-binding protein